MSDNFNTNKSLISSRLSRNLESNRLSRNLESNSFLKEKPNLNSNLSSELNSNNNSHSSESSELNKLFKSPEKFFKNKYVLAVLYIILILYASVIAPKLPNWITSYLEYPIVKIFIVFLVGILATQDATAAIIATIGVTITYLFISEYKDTNDIQKIYDKENDETKKQSCVPSVKPKIEQFNTKKVNTTRNVEQFNTTRNVEQFNTKKVNTTRNVEHFDTKNEKTSHNVEYFDVLNNNNKNYINHVEEHF
jgi:hypothetical protein